MKKLIFCLLVTLTVPAFSQLHYLSGRAKATFKADSNYCAYYGYRQVVVIVAHDSTTGSLWFCVNNDSTQAVRLRSLTGYGETITFTVPNMQFFRIKSDSASIPWRVVLTNLPNK
jgi:hypothetical protein